MASGKTEELRKFDNQNYWRIIKQRETTPRDRSLRGKARTKARKDANKAEKA